MKIPKNKLFLWGVLSIIFLLSFQVYHAYSQSIRDTSSYVSVVRWEVFLNDAILVRDKKYPLESGDMIRTWVESIGVIEWWDGSITRVWSQSELRVDQSEITQDRSYIDISFELFSGKTWSQVVSFLGTDSSFSQKFEWLEAGVRGTVFDVDLESWFIRATEHAIELIDSTHSQLIITPEAPYDIEARTFIDIDVFLRAFQDLEWTEYNILSDKAYREELIKQLRDTAQEYNPFLKIMQWFFPEYRILYELDTASEFESVEVQIMKLTSNKRSKVFDAVQKRYQDYNFISGAEEELYERKLFYQEALLLLSDDSAFQASLMQRALLDIDWLIEAWKTTELSSLLDILSEYPELIPQLDTNILQQWLEMVPEDLRGEFQRSFVMIEDIFWIHIESITNIKPQDILNNTSGAIENFLEENLGDRVRNWLQ